MAAALALCLPAQRLLPETGVLPALADAETQEATIGFVGASASGTDAVVLRMPRRVTPDTISELQVVSADGAVKRLFTGTLQTQALAASPDDGLVFAVTTAGRETTCHLIRVADGGARQFACNGNVSRAAFAKGRLALLQFAADQKMALNLYRLESEGAGPVLEASFPLPMAPWMKVVFAGPERLLLLDPSSALTMTPFVFAEGKWSRAADVIALSGPEAEKVRGTVSPASPERALGVMRMIHVMSTLTARDGSLLFVMSGGGPKDDPGPRIVAFDSNGKETASYRPAGDRKLLRPNLAYTSGDSIVFFDRSGVRHRFERP